MKNIHVLPKDIFNQLGVDHYGKTPTQIKIAEFLINKNIYITSPNEDINENDYIITKDGRLVEVSYLLSKDLEGASKVILTTDQDLIKDSVQAIDNEFLEWFVKNPSCEEVKVVYEPKNFLDTRQGWEYTIISKIPKEDWLLNNPHCKQIESCSKSLSKKCICPKEEPKQETLEEAATNYLHRVADGKRNTGYADEDFINGAKWQAGKVFNDDVIQTLEKALAILLKRQERMYNENEVELIANEMVNWAIDNVGNPNPQSGRKFDEVISKFKKK